MEFDGTRMSHWDAIKPLCTSAPAGHHEVPGTCKVILHVDNVENYLHRDMKGTGATGALVQL